MIETVNTYAELDTNPLRVFDWLASSPPGWNVTQRHGSDDLAGTLTGPSTPFGRLRVYRDRAIPTEDGIARYVLAAEGNLPVMLHGKDAKHLTMRPEHVPDAVQVYSDALYDACPPLRDVLPRVRLTRVDASMTWRHEQPHQAARALSQARAHLTAQRSGRRVVSAYGVETVACRFTRQHLVRAYDKTAESLAAARGTGVVPDLGSGVLVRLEVQHSTKTARRLYGDDLTALSRFGADMARKAVETAAEPFARDLSDMESPTAAAARLIAAGASPSRSVTMLGVAALMKQGGIPALTSLGIPIATAYRWRAELGALEGREPDSFDRGVEVQLEMEQEQEALRADSLWDTADVAYYDRDDS